MPPKNAPTSEKGKKLNVSQLAVWASVFPEKERTTAVAVALAESGGEYAVIGPVNSNGTRDYGAWQINSVHADLFEKYPQWWTYTNAYMAKAVWDAQGWGAWSTYKSGAYIPFLPIAQIGVSTPGASNTIGDEVDEGSADDRATQEAAWFRDTKDALAQIGNAIASIAQGAFKAAVWMADPHNWVRAALVGLGGALVVGALVMVAKPNTGVVQATIAAPQAAVQKVTK